MRDDFISSIAAELGFLSKQGLRRPRRTVTRRPGGRCEIAGRTLVDFASNDYLGLSHDPRLIDAAREALLESGVGSGASALVAGRSAWHERLERRLARFENQPTALLFPTGFAANVGIVSALAGREDALFSDRLNHGSLIDGCRLSRAVIHVFDHNSLDELETQLESAFRARRRIVITDGVFSMDGTIAPLPEICRIAERNGAFVVVDEAHATGVFGQNGRGIAELCGVEKRVAVRVGTLSKAVGSLGGFVAGSHELIEYLWNSARTQIFSTALPPASCAVACAALDVIENEPERRVKLMALSRQLRQGFATLGLQSVEGSVGPIVPVIVGEPNATIAAAARLEQSGFLVGAMRPPSVPAGSCRLRITLSAVHEAADVDQLLEALAHAVPRAVASR